MDFSDEQLERYSRHMILKEIGVKGQKKLLASKVLVIGTGGLGSSAAMYLAAAGIGTIGLVDFDVVDLSNLQRQIIHSTRNVGKAKVQSAKETICEMNPDVKVITYEVWMNSTNIIDIIRDQNYDFVIDGTDNFPAKFLINDACVMEGKPFSHAGMVGFFGQTITYVPGKGPCYRCIFKNPPPPNTVPSCKEAGILSTMGGIIGTIQATEAIKYILGIGELLIGKLLTYDALDMEFRTLELKKDECCQVCGENASIKTLVDYDQKNCEEKR